MILDQYLIILTCDYGTCMLRGEFHGSTKGIAITTARLAGWSVSGDKCRCPKHKGMRDA